MTGKNLLRIHAAGLAFPAGARTDHEVMRPVDDRFDQGGNKARNITAIAIEKHQHVAFIGNRRHARRTGATVPPWCRNYSCSSVSGAFRG